MKGLGQIIADNARADGRLALAYTVYVVVDPTIVAESIPRTGDFPIEAEVRDEIASNLESISYVQSVTVRRRVI